MKPRPFARVVDTARRCVLAGLLAGLALPAAALYKVVGPDGRITYTDRPPVDTGSRVSTLGGSGAITDVPAPNSLPFELRQASTRFPVTLYVTGDCPPCDTARQQLMLRGVPFSEKLVLNADDVAALERLVGVRTVPTLTIGSQVLSSFAPAEWNAYLDAAGYPRESRLPRSWQQPEPTPMVARPSLPSPVAAPAPAPAAPAAAPAPAAPSGLRF